MRTSSIAEAKAKLSSLVAHVKLGEEVILTERGKPVARIVPLQLTEDDALSRMVARGLVRPADPSVSYSSPRVESSERVWPDRDDSI